MAKTPDAAPGRTRQAPPGFSCGGSPPCQAARPMPHIARRGLACRTAVPRDKQSRSHVGETGFGTQFIDQQSTGASLATSTSSMGCQRKLRSYSYKGFNGSILSASVSAEIPLGPLSPCHLTASLGQDCTGRACCVSRRRATRYDRLA
jgi:hypothetical protein